jgi:thiamine-monophosphate kinase
VADSFNPTTQEHSIIHQIKDWTGSKFIGDDCAMLPGQVLATVDTLVEGTHFLTSISSFEDIGWKSVAVNLSDIAAMGGVPEYMLVSLTLPASFTRHEFKRLYSGIIDCSQTYRTQVVGGDLTSGPQLVLSITVLGAWHKNGCLRRSGARPGDLIVATGDFGASAAGFWFLQNRGNAPVQKLRRPRFPYATTAHQRPVPRLEESWALVDGFGSRGALMDTSDGLGDALWQIATASKVLMQVDLNRVPVHFETRKIAALAKTDVQSWVLYGGEDYQLVGCAPEEIWDNWDHELKTQFAVVGRVLSGEGVELIRGEQKGPPLELSKAFQQIHF